MIAIAPNPDAAGEFAYAWLPLWMTVGFMPAFVSAVASCWSVAFAAVVPRMSTFALQVEHAPSLHPCPFAHALPQAPQFFGSVCTFASHPSEASPLQSEKFGLHPATPHTPFA